MNKRHLALNVLITTLLLVVMTSPLAANALTVAVGQPVLRWPNNGASMIGSHPTFDWDDVIGATTYLIQVSSNNTFTKLWVHKPVTVSEYTPPNSLPAGVLLYWRVLAYDAMDTPGPWSKVRTLTLQMPAPTLIAPVTGSLFYSTSPTLFRWSRVAGAITYTFQISIYMNYSEVVYTFRNLVDNSLTLPRSLPAGRYYWRVAPVGLAGLGGWSTSFIFTIH